MQNRFSSTRISPPQILMYGFIITILLGTGLLMLPYSTTGGIFIIDAFFTATSAVCVTGLIVRNTAADFTFFGKAVILFLIQVGGLGYMSMATFIALLAGKKIGITQRMMIKESLNIVSHEGLVKFVKGMLLFVLAAEGLGTALLYSRFAGEYNTGESFFLAVFHSISAFNNAGFSLFEDNLIGYRSDVLMNLSIMSLVFFGGIGFSVVDDIYGRIRRQEKRVMLHTRLALITSGILIIAGAALIYVNEREYLFLQSGFGGAERVLSSLFASVTSRTAGFNTVDYSLLQPATLFLTIILMFIGASPGSTGGGIKTTTFSIILLHIWSTIRGRQETVAFSRRIPADFVSRSLVILSLSVIYITVVTFLIVDIEHTQFIGTLFEVVSAFATVGLSIGDGGVRSLSANFSDISKLIMIITMFAGRLGPLTLFMALIDQAEHRVRYPDGRVMIG